MLQTITKRNTAAGKMTFLRQLLHSGLGADRGFDAFAGRLPVTDIIQQLVHMSIKPLLPFLGTPHFNAVFHKPFYNKRCFVLSAPQSVKHKYQQNIEFVLQGITLNFLNGVPVFC